MVWLLSLKRCIVIIGLNISCWMILLVWCFCRGEIWVFVVDDGEILVYCFLGWFGDDFWFRGDVNWYFDAVVFSFWFIGCVWWIDGVVTARFGLWLFAKARFWFDAVVVVRRLRFVRRSVE